MASTSTKTARLGLRLAVNLCLLLGGLLVSLIAGEVLIRLVAPRVLYRFPPGLFRNEHARGYGLTPGFCGVVHTSEYKNRTCINRQGLRSPRDYPGKATAGTLRVMALGDSFTNGYAVSYDESYPSLLEHMLSARLGRTAEVMNAGTPGYSPRQELLYLEENGIGLQPDIIILGFFLGNDITGNIPLTSDIEVVDGFLVAKNISKGFMPVGLRLFLSRRSELYNFLWPIQRRFRYGHEQSKAELALHKYTLQRPSPIDDEWTATLDVIKQISLVARASGSRLVVAAFPERRQVYRNEWQRDLQRLGVDTSNYDVLGPNRRLREGLITAGIEFLDITPAMVIAANTIAALYYPVDGHWTANGNRVAAETIAEYLTQ